MNDVQVFAGEESVMTVQQVANALSVSTDTVRNCIRRIMPNKMQNGKTTYLNESEIAVISRDVANNTDVQKQITSTDFMTIRNVADVLGVSYSSVHRVVSKLFPTKMQNGKTAFLNEQEVACISKELKGDYHTSQLTFSAGEKVKNTTTELEVLGNAIAAFDSLRNLYAQKEAEYKAIIEQKDQQLEIQAPKVEVYDSISDSSTLQDLQTVAQTIKLKNIFEVLKADKILEEKMTADGTKYYKPYARYAEYLVLKDGKAWTDNRGKKHIRPRVFVTGKGLLWLTKKYKAAC